MAPKNQRMSQNVRDALEFFKFDKVPSSKVLHSKYRAEAAKVHPDKNNDSNESKEAFQELQRHLNVLVDYVKKNDVSKDVSDEERESREFFEKYLFSHITYSNRFGPILEACPRKRIW